VQATHTTVVVSAPGLGDDVQAIKAGILEIADIHVVSKCDRSDANKTITDLKMMLGLGLREGTAWQPPVVPTSGETGEGIEALLTTIDQHRAHLEQSGELAQRRRQTAEMRMLKTAEDILRRRFVGSRDGVAAELLERVIARDIDPYAAALRLLAALHEGETT
jgi:LAO/AO transport system kinase